MKQLELFSKKEVEEIHDLKKENMILKIHIMELENALNKVKFILSGIYIDENNS